MLCPVGFVDCCNKCFPMPLCAITASSFYSLIFVAVFFFSAFVLFVNNLLIVLCGEQGDDVRRSVFISFGMRVNTDRGSPCPFGSQLSVATFHNLLPSVSCFIFPFPLYSYPIQSPRPGCYGDREDSPGVRNYGTRSADELFDVYCFAKQLQGESVHVKKKKKAWFHC